MKLVLANTSKLKKIQIHDSKIPNHLIHMENEIVELLKKLRQRQGDSLYQPFLTCWTYFTLMHM